MARKDMNAVVQLRRDSEQNFSSYNIVLQDGEIAIVYTPFQGTRIKIGDGITPFRSLPYDTFGLMARGFLDASSPETVFLDNTLHEINHEEHILFLDIQTGFLYYWDPIAEKYQYVKQNQVPAASADVAGVMKLYDTLNGTNTDGSVTQAALNTAMSRIQHAANNVTFEMDSNDVEQLNADLGSLTALQILD